MEVNDLKVNDVKAIILAAGRGSRMKQLTRDRPKCLLKVGDKSLLDRQLAALRAAGIDETGIVTGYRREMLQFDGITEFYNPDWQSTNMVSSLLCASSWLETCPCVISYSDIFYQPDAVISLINASAGLALTYDANWLDLWRKRFSDPLEDAETFVLGENDELLEIGQKPPVCQHNAVPDKIHGQYMGLIYITPEAWKKVLPVLDEMNESKLARLYLTDLLQLVIARKILPIRAVRYELPWGEVDSEADLDLYQSGTNHQSGIN